MTKPLPKIPNAFRYSEEITFGGITNYIRNLVYDMGYNAVRYEKRNIIPSQDTFFTTDYLTFVNDYNLGVSFVLNKKHGNCSITSIAANSIDNDQNYTETLLNAEGSFILRLKSPESFLLLDSDYVFTGSRRANNIPAYIYVSDRSTNRSSFVTEFAFSDVRSFYFQQKRLNFLLFYFVCMFKDSVSFQDSFQNDKSIPISLLTNIDGVSMKRVLLKML